MQGCGGHARCDMMGMGMVRMGMVRMGMAMHCCLDTSPTHIATCNRPQ